MAEVFVAEDLLLHRQVAVKVVHLAAADVRERLQREGQALARLDHPALVPVYDIGEDDDTPFLVMQLVEGQTLQQRLADDGTLPAADVAMIADDLLPGLAHAHDLGVVHRDIKPANILLGVDGRPRLVDFGIARMTEGTSLTATGTALGTAAYLAPEQVRGDEIGPAADVYSLGLVLLECLTGTKAYDGPPAEAAIARLTRPVDVPADLPQPWSTVLTGMTATHPDRRLSVRDVRDALRDGGIADDATVAMGVASDETSVLPTVDMPLDRVSVNSPRDPVVSKALPDDEDAAGTTAADHEATDAHQALGEARTAAEVSAAVPTTSGEPVTRQLPHWRWLLLAFVLVAAVGVGIGLWSAPDSPEPEPTPITTVSGATIPDDVVDALDLLTETVQP